MTAAYGMTAGRGGWKVPLLLCLLVVAGLALIEAGHPYFFLQCDNRDYFLPVFVHNVRAVLGGEFPLFNFHQHLGIPVTLQYATLYLPNYLAVLLSDALLGHPFGTMELLAFFHLPLAALGFYRLMRCLGLDDAAGFFGGLGWALCGFVVTGANSWSHVGAMAVWMPWILLFSLRHSMGGGRRDFAILVALRSTALFTGSPQTFACLALFDTVLVALIYLLARRSTPDTATFPRPYDLLLRIAANYACVALVTLPFLVQAFHQVSVSYERQAVFSWLAYTANSYNPSYWLHGLVAPFTKLGYRFWPEQDFISHIGYLPLLFIAAAAAMMKNSARRATFMVLLALAAVAFLWSADLLVTRVMYEVPVFNRFRAPFKLQFFTSFFLVAAASFGFDSFMAWCRDRCRCPVWIAAAIILLHLGSMVSLYALWPQRVFSKHEDPVPFDEPLKTRLTNGRIVSVGLDVVHDGEHTLWGESGPSIGFNYATLWGLQHFGGYDALLPEKNFQATLNSNFRSDFNVAPGDTLDVQAVVPLEHFRVWGVRWYVVDRNIPLANAGPLRQVYEDRYRRVYTDPGPRPMAGWGDGSGESVVRHRFTTNSMVAETDRDTQGSLLLNVLYNHRFIATVDGVPTMVTETADGQVALDVPGGRHTVRLTYTDRPFLMAATFSGCVVMIAASWFVIGRLRCRQSACHVPD